MVAAYFRDVLSQDMFLLTSEFSDEIKLRFWRGSRSWVNREKASPGVKSNTFITQS